MKIYKHFISTAAALFVASTLSAQTVFPGKQTIDKVDYLGLTLSQNVPEKYLSDYWENYLNKFGKPKSKRSVYSIEKASIPSISSGPVQVMSQIGSSKGTSQIFLALNADGQYVTSTNDEDYRAAEALLKDFSAYASLNEEVRTANELFTASEKSYQKLIKENEGTAKDIEKTEKKLAELKTDLEKGKASAETSLVDLQNKQKALEAVRAKVPALK